jgi:AraC-like DNA-binding protein/mannose-6-phosphate isomerase-like protein (cupin superfamily)
MFGRRRPGLLVSPANGDTLDNLKQSTKPAQEDALSEMLRSLRVSTTVFCRSAMGAPWGFAVKAHGRAAFHVILDGSCWLEVDGIEERVRLRSGDVVVLARGPGHRLVSQPRAPIVWLDDILAEEPIVKGRLMRGGAGAKTDLICGVFEIDSREAVPLLRALPEIAHVRGADGAPPAWLGTLLQLVDEESAQFTPGSESVLARLTDIMLIQVMRQVLLSGPALQPVYDRRVATALRLLREHPDRAWTLAQLAAAAASSRSAFNDRFRESTGMPPMRYLVRLRLAMAASELRGGDATLAEIAARVGYGSEVALSKAFRREFGVSPSEYRTAARRNGDAAQVAELPSAVTA